MTVTASTNLLAAATLRTELLDGAELALVDIREGDAFLRGHISVAVPIPNSELELSILDRVPRLSTRLVLIGSSDGGEATGAAARLAALGYTHVRVLDGGVEAWVAQGYELITGANALSKALGEFVERRYHTPRITVQELKAKLDRAEDLIVLDTRPEAEFRSVAIPTGRLASGAELLYRVFDQLPSERSQVVVNCAGRTRAIIGAQALINAGLGNPVVSLENGTSAWRFAGYEPVSGVGELLPTPSQEGLTRARQAGSRIRDRFAVAVANAQELAAWREDDERTLYVFDVRSPAEYDESHLVRALSVPGGQLVQATDQYIGTRHARVVLVDTEDLVRSSVTASWLVQLGLDDVFVYGIRDGDPAQFGPPIQTEPDFARLAETVSPDQLSQLLSRADAVTVIDLQRETPYFDPRHFIAGSLCARRSTLLRKRRPLPEELVHGTVVLVSVDGRLARLAAAELSATTDKTVYALDGGMQAWVNRGLPIQAGVDQEPLFVEDGLDPEPTLEERKRQFDEYVAWGDRITDQLERDGIVSFRVFGGSNRPLGGSN